MLKLWFIGILILCACCAVNAQQAAGTKTLFQLTRYSDSLISQNGAEKLYIQFDKPYYAISDTIWLKAYLLNDPTYGLSARSRLLHIDIANDSNKVVKQLLLSLQEGLAWGNISLDDKIFKPGDYTLRAYTNWMRNFGEETFFYKNIRIAGANESAWLINSRIGKGTGTESIKALFQLTTIDKRPLVDSTLNAELVAGSKLTSRQHLKTDRNGMVGMNLLPDALGKQEIILQNNSKSKKVIIPVILSRPEKTDIQFMPEGGSLVADLPARIGFKAIGEDGRGVTISGVITDRKDGVVASFHTLHNVMGSFYMQPQAGESYKAKVSLPDAVIRYYPLPAVKGSGMLLQIKNLPGTDSLDV
ncbi:MAG TPA: hypothetical protein VHS53_05430, partial [Mucilaginibacter sp.]|nr:hypothetical protein [Mucilaginibacter sp.]